MSDIQIKKKKDRTCLGIEGDLTIQHVAAMKNTILGAVRKSGMIEINLEAVTSLDLAGLQLLCSAAQTLKKENKEIHMIGVIPETIKSFIQNAGYLRSANCLMKVDGECLWVTGGKS